MKFWLPVKTKLNVEVILYFWIHEFRKKIHYIFVEVILISELKFRDKDQFDI